MKRITAWICLLTWMLSAAAQISDDVTLRLPGKGRINVEQLNGKIDLGMDISQLSVSELRVLRNAFAARQGYCFMEADLRELYGATTWYERQLWIRTENWDIEKECAVPPPPPVSYSKAELAFINRLKAREEELKKQNFVRNGQQGMQPRLDHLVNPYQLKEIPQPLATSLEKNGFAIVPAGNMQLFHVYERNDYHDFPSFVTTDLYLQLFHLYFDSLLRQLETDRLYGQLEAFCRDLYEQTEKKNDKKTKDFSLWNKAYIAIARTLLTGEELPAMEGKYRSEAEKEVQAAINASDDFSTFLGYEEMKFGYGLFRPRGHYTRCDSLKRYFRSMMWLQHVPFGTDKEEQFQRSLLLAETIGGTPSLRKQYTDFTEPITYLMGAPDNISIIQVYEEMQKMGMTAAQLIGNKKAMKQLRQTVEEIGRRQTRIQPKFQITSSCKINLMPQRYQPDAEVLQEMVDYETLETLRDVPKGLDVMAAMGVTGAERILVDELNEPGRWSQYTPMLTKMKQRMQEVDWHETLATQWIEALATMAKNTPERASMPYFMQSQAWEKKDLNAALASWAELKHDAILYAKQPMGAECGGGGPPEPTVRGYVEPNVVFWKKAIDLLDTMDGIFGRFGLATERTTSITEDLREQAQFLLNCSEKELRGETLSEWDYNQIEIIGSTFESISLELTRDPQQWLMGWSDVEGTDRKVALVADVYTANARNNPQKSILYEGVGLADEIYVVVEINGYLYLTRGAVLSYREFKESLDVPRKTDEEWQQELNSHLRKGVPAWMKEITVPLDVQPQDDEEVFYSSGC